MLPSAPVIMLLYWIMWNW